MLYAPRYSRYTALLLAAAIAVGCSGAVAALSGSDPLNAIDLSLSACLGGIVSQLSHSLSLSTEVHDV